jgi:hypothetical protein
MRKPIIMLVLQVVILSPRARLSVLLNHQAQALLLSDMALVFSWTTQMLCGSSVVTTDLLALIQMLRTRASMMCSNSSQIVKAIVLQEVNQETARALRFVH